MKNHGNQKILVSPAIHSIGKPAMKKYYKQQGKVLSSFWYCKILMYNENQLCILMYNENP